MSKGSGMKLTKIRKPTQTPCLSQRGLHVLHLQQETPRKSQMKGKNEFWSCTWERSELRGSNSPEATQTLPNALVTQNTSQLPSVSLKAPVVFLKKFKIEGNNTCIYISQVLQASLCTCCFHGSFCDGLLNSVNLTQPESSETKAYTGLTSGYICGTPPLLFNGVGGPSMPWGQLVLSYIRKLYMCHCARQQAVLLHGFCFKFLSESLPWCPSVGLWYKSVRKMHPFFSKLLSVIVLGLSVQA